MSRLWIRRSLAVAIACWAGGLGMSQAKPQQNSLRKPTQPSSAKATTKTLGGAERYQTFVSTDKPIYRAGEKVYVRGILLNAANHKPLVGTIANATVEIKGPKGDVVAGGTAPTQDSVWAFAWDVPAGQAGGEYKVHITYPWDGHAPAERKFDIRSYRAPRLKSQITFLRDGYAPGDKVTATLDVKRAEGGIPEGAKVTVSAQVDGIEISANSSKVDARGLCTVNFDLPHKIPRGEGTLALTIEDGGVVETASKTIPILLQTVDLQLFPEGGDLIAGYKNRVYLQAKQPDGKPADLVGKILSKQMSAPVSTFRTEHEGRGRFDFTPVANREYFLSISQPSGIKHTYPLPRVKSLGAVLRSDKDVFAKGQPVTVQVGTTMKGSRVTVSKREVELATQNVEPGTPGQLHSLSFALPADADGVLTVTVWDSHGIPLAERLVFRQEDKPLKITVTPQKKSYSPGDRAKVTIKTTDANGKPVSAVVGLAVTDDSVLEMVEKRDQAPNLPVMVLLESEVKDLADAHIYLNAKNPKAQIATDLLLGTQGWRRFALMDLAKFLEAEGDPARRVVALKIQSEADMGMAMAGGGGGGFGEGMNANGPMGFAVAKGAPMPMAMPAAPMAAAPMPVPHAMAPHPADEFKAKKERAANNVQLEEAGQMAAPKQMAAAKPMAAPRAMAEQQLNQAEAMPASPRPVLRDRSEPAMEKVQSALKMAAGKDSRRAIAAGAISSNLSNLIIVREFAHQARKDRKPTDRVDFAETLYWNSGVKTAPNTGEATISFALNDSVSSFKIFADGFTSAGSIGAENVSIDSVQPFYAEAKLPLEVSSGDKILLPISLINGSNKSLSSPNVKVAIKGDFKIAALEKGHAEIGAGARVRWIQAINVGSGNGAKDFTLTAKAGTYEDKVERKLSVKPMGFPVEASFGGLLAPGKSVTHTITIPKNVVASSIVSNTAVYPTPLANMTQALQRMIQDPYGCFEQTSSTSYPLTMAQQYFLSHQGVDPKLVEESRQKLDAGYKRLVGFWCPDKGYEWFGENPGHEALTAFGLLHFSDMSQVRDVDQNMVSSTRAWLLKQKDGHGGFTRKRRSLHSWIEDKDCSNAYIVWALLESGQKASELKAEIDSLKAAATATQNNYVVALAANALYLAGDKPAAKQLMERLAAKQKTDGSVDSVKSSIVGSEGESLEIEGSSLATLAWMRDPAYAGNVEKSIKFLADSCQGGRFGSTQSTVLALRAIVTHDKLRAHPKTAGKVRLYVDGQSIGDWSEFTPTTQGAIKLPDLSELLSPGDHKLELRMEGGSEMPYSMAVKYNAVTPTSSKNCKVDITAKLAQVKLVEGATTEAKVTVINKTKEIIPTPVAIVGLPGGMEPRHDQLKELVKKGTIDAYEVLGREVVLYWRSLPAEAKVEVPLSLIAAIPGSYTGPSSRAYLYYTDENKKWIDGMHVEIAAK